MKKRYLFASLLVASLLMASCAKSEESNSNFENNQTSNEQSSTDSTSSVESSKDSTASESSKDSNSQDSSSTDLIPGPDDGEKPNVPTFNNAIEVYKASALKMQDLNYEMVSKGTSHSETIFTSSDLTIYELFQHRTDAIYFEKSSNGKPIAGIPTAYAERAYLSKNRTVRSSSQTKEKWPESDGVINVEEWTSPVESDIASIYKEFGKNGDNYVNFILNNETVTPESNKIQKDGDNYILNFDLIIDNGIQSKAIMGYSDQVNTMSKSKMVNAKKFSVSLVIGKDLRPISYTTHEEYTVNKMLDADVTNDLTYTFKYYETKEDLPLKSF